MASEGGARVHHHTLQLIHLLLCRRRRQGAILPGQIGIPQPMTRSMNLGDSFCKQK